MLFDSKNRSERLLPEYFYLYVKRDGTWPYSRYLHVKIGTESWVGLTEKVGSGNKSERISDQLTTRGHVFSHKRRKTPFKVNTKTRKIFFT